MKQEKRAEEYTAFENFLKRVVSVPHSEIKAELEKEKREKQKRPKASDASREDEQTD